MKYIHFFETENARDAAYDYSLSTYEEPWVSYTEEGKLSDFNVPPTIKLICDDGTVFKAYGDDIDDFNGTITTQMLYNAGYDYLAPMIGFANYIELNRFLRYWGDPERGVLSPETSEEFMQFLANVLDVFGVDCESATIGKCLEEFGAQVLATDPFSRIGKNIVKVVFGDDVTTIGSEALGFVASAAEEFYIGKNVTSIANNAFIGRVTMKFVACEATTPPTLGSDAFPTTINPIFAVPEASEADYKSASGWDNYADKIFGVL